MKDSRGSFFDRLAPNWSQSHYGAGGGMVPRIARFAQALATVVPAPADVLDYGCGTGDIAVRLAALGYHVKALDASPRMIENARIIHAQSGVQFNVIEPRKESHDVNLPDSLVTQDAIVCSSVLEYLHDLPTSLGALRAQLKPEGWLLATVPNIAHWMRRGERRRRFMMRSPLFRKFIQFTPRRERYELQWLSRNHLPTDQWAGLFRSAGFGVVWQDCLEHPLTLLIARRDG